MHRLLLLFFLAVPCDLLAQENITSLDLRNIISELRLAANYAEDSGEPVLLVDKIPSWENLVDSAARVQSAVESSMKKSEETISNLRKSAERYADNHPRKAVYQERIDLLENQSETLFVLSGQLNEATAKLKDVLTQIKNDPAVKAFMEAQALDKRIDQALERADQAVPAILKE